MWFWEHFGQSPISNWAYADNAETHCTWNHTKPSFCSPADPGGPWGPGPPLPPILFSKSCSFQAILRENPLFWANVGLSSPSWGQNSAGPLTKILHPPLLFTSCLLQEVHDPPTTSRVTFPERWLVIKFRTSAPEVTESRSWVPLGHRPAEVKTCVVSIALLECHLRRFVNFVLWFGQRAQTWSHKSDPNSNSPTTPQF